MTDQEPSKAYDPAKSSSAGTGSGWSRAASAEATSTKPAFSIILPPPNVTGSLHMGHALTATIEDILVRWQRMSGYNALWLPGTDHAGIATQMVVERELQATEKKIRHDLGREEFVERVWAVEGHVRQAASASSTRRWAPRSTGRASASRWTRARRAAVREAFVRLYEEGLIYRGAAAHQLVSALPHRAVRPGGRARGAQGLALAHRAIRVEGRAGRVLIVATTRPETMLGDTAVAVHPEDPRYPDLVGKSVVLPLTGREIPIIADAQLVDMEFGTGAVKVTPAHDFNDYEIGLRHKLPMISILDLDGTHERRRRGLRGLDRYRGAQAGARGSRRRRACSSSDEAAQRCRVGPLPALGTRGRAACCRSSGSCKTEPLAKPAIDAVEQGKTKFVPETLDARRTSTGCATSTTGASRASCGGATTFRPGTASCSPSWRRSRRR